MSVFDIITNPLLWAGFFIAGVLFYGTRPKVEMRYSLAIRQLPHVLTALRDKGLEGADVKLDHPLSSRSLEFRKYLNDKQYGFAMVLPIIEWTDPFREEVREMLASINVPVIDKPSKRKNGLPVMWADFGKDVEAAHEAARRIFREIYGVPIADNLECRTFGILQGADLMDHPDKQPAEWMRFVQHRRRKD